MKLVQNKRLWLLLTLLSIMSIWDIPNAPIFKIGLWLRIVYVIAVGALKGSVILAVYNFCQRWHVLKFICVIFIVFYALIAVVNFVSYEFYGFGLTRKMMFIVAQTTLNEVQGFVPGLYYNILNLFRNPIVYLWLVLGIVSFYGVKYIGDRYFRNLVVVIAGMGVVSFICYCSYFTSGRTAHFLTARMVKYGLEVYEWDRQFKNLKASKVDLPDKETVSSRHLATNVVVVLGESASRGHHSLYGYDLPTTPCLDAIRDSLFIFTDAIGSSASTTGNMERILSFKEDDLTTGDGLEYPLVVDLFNEAGYKTFWLSNQERTGSVSNTSGVMTMNANVIKYAGAENSEDALAMKFDDVLLPYLCEALSDTAKNKMIFLHLYGSHVEYSSRYPISFQKFNADDELRVGDSLSWLDESMAQRRAEYDNSILYTDYILNNIIKKVSVIDEPSLVVYFSDHGESVYDDGVFSGRNERSVEVPFIMFANSSYLATYPEMKNIITSTLSKPFSTANVVYMLMTVTGSSYLHYNSELDVLSEHYIVRPRYVDEKIWLYDQQ